MMDRKFHGFVSLVVVGVVLLSACQRVEEPRVTIFAKGQFPEKLSQWGVVFVQGNELVVNPEAVIYDLISPLFSDYSHKLRTIWVPAGKTGEYSSRSDINLPVGSVVSKTFFYPRRGDELLQTSDTSWSFSSSGLDLDHVRLIETRLMVHLEDGWQGLAYVWDVSQTDAVLEITGASVDLKIHAGKENQQFTYIVPDFNQCQGCHIEDLNTGDMGLIGVKTRHLNKSYLYSTGQKNQLARLNAAGFLSNVPAGLPHNTAWDDVSADINERARSYLDINCGHCHNPVGAADTSGLFLHKSESNPLRLGLCKPPVAAGQGTGNRVVGIQPGNANVSILSYRMQSLNLGAMMPELGRSIVHNEGVALIDDWINQMPGDC